MHKKYKQLVSLLLLMVSNLTTTSIYSVTSASGKVLTRKLKIQKPTWSMNTEKKQIMQSIPKIKSKRNTKIVESNKLPSGFTYIDGLCLDSAALGSTDVYKKAVLSSYDAQINEIVRRSAYFGSIKSLPLPTLQLDLLTTYAGFDHFNNTKPVQPLTGIGDHEGLTYKVSFELSTGVFGFAKMITEQQLGSADFHVKSINLYFEICKAIQTYLTCVKKLKCMQAQAYDFKKDDDETQARYKVGSVSGLTAIQSKQWLNTAVTKVEEFKLDLVNAKTKLLQYTPHLTDDDFKNLDRLSTTQNPYIDLNLENLSQNELEKLPLVISSKLKSKLARMSGINSFLRTILPILSVEAKPLVSENSDQGTIMMKATWSMGLNTIADCGHHVLDARKTILESQKTAQMAKIEQQASIRQYKLHCRIHSLINTKVEGCVARLSQHNAMDRNDPESHLEKRSKLKEDLYKARLEQIEHQDKISVALLEYLRVTGLLAKDISDSISRYNNQMELDKYKSNYLRRRNTEGGKKKMMLPAQTKPSSLLSNINSHAAQNNSARRKMNIRTGQSKNNTGESVYIGLAQKNDNSLIRNDSAGKNVGQRNSNMEQSVRQNSIVKNVGTSKFNQNTPINIKIRPSQKSSAITPQ